jgi:hypothetical protein
VTPLENGSVKVKLHTPATRHHARPGGGVLSGRSGGGRRVDSSGMESPFSSEVSYLVPLNVPIVNQPPTLNAINNLTINENAGLQTVSLSGITSGATNENQTLTVTAASSNTGLIPNPTVNYTSANTTGTLTFTPVANGYGTATITVTVNDGGTSNNIVTKPSRSRSTP